MRVIKADDLLSMIGTKKGMIGACGLRRFIEVMAIDVPEIIHCKDCKYAENWCADICRCFLWVESGIDVFEDGYCNYAERRTDD